MSFSRPRGKSQNQKVTDEDVFRAILSHKQQHDGNSPTLQAICDATGLYSKTTVIYHLDSLQRRGLLRAHSPRIETTGGQWVYSPLKN